MRIISNEELLCVAGGDGLDGGDFIVDNSFDNSFSNPEFGEKKKKSSGDGSGGGEKKEAGQPNPPQTPEQAKAILEALISALPGAKITCTGDIKGNNSTVGDWSLTCTGTAQTGGGGGKQP